jgi:hypothetical protein
MEPHADADCMTRAPNASPFLLDAAHTNGQSAQNQLTTGGHENDRRYDIYLSTYRDVRWPQLSLLDTLLGEHHRE